MSKNSMTQLDRDIDTLRDVYMTNSQREALARLQAVAADAENRLACLKDACAMHLLYLSGQNAGGTAEMVGSHNMRAAAWRLRHTCELPLDQSHAQMMTKLRAALTLAFGEASEAQAVQS